MTDEYDNQLRHWWAHEMLGVPFDPTWLLAKAQMLTESGGDPLAESPAGAVGLFQLMPATAEDLDVTDRTDPGQSIHGGIKYLHRQYSIFRSEAGWERWSFALASYNCGASNVLKAQAIAKTKFEPTNTWRTVAPHLYTVTGNKSSETIAYVAKIRALYDELNQKETET